MTQTQTREREREIAARKLALLENQQNRFNPEMLTLAREFHGMTVTKLAELLSVSPGYVSQLEDGIKIPTDDLVARLVGVMKFPTNHYYQSGTREAAHPSFYRRRVNVPQPVLRMASARMCEIKKNLEKLLSNVEAPPVRFLRIEPEECAGGVTEVASKMRLHLRIPPGPIRNLVNVFEDAGGIVVPFDFGTKKIDACSDWVAGHPVVFVSRMIQASRLRHTLAHEMGHIIMHDFITDACEDDADHFAAEFNLPANEIKRELAPVSLERLARLKLKWKSSMAALLYRAESLGVISERTARYQWMMMRRYRYHEVEPHEDMMPVEKPAALRELIEVFLTKLQFSKEALIGFLAIFEGFFDEVYSGEPSLRVI